VTSPAQIAKAVALERHLRWTRASFNWVNKRKLLPSPHIEMISAALDRVMAGKSTRLLINMPPRYGKTLLGVQALSSRILAKNPGARIMHTSYSQSLVQKNSRAVKQVLETEGFQQAFPEARIAHDAYAKAHWNTTAGGEFHAVSTSSQITGFEAGIGDNPWDGCLIIDDPEKSSDMTSAPYRSEMKDVVGQAITTRLNHERTPVIVIQQRLHADDISNWLMSGGTGDRWDVLCLQALSETGRPPEHYRDYSHADVIPYQLEPGPLWPERKSREALLKIRDAQEDTSTDEPRGARVFAAQYQQSPSDTSIAMYDPAWLRYYGVKDLPWSLSDITLRIDTAQKGSKGSDYNGLAIFGHDKRDPSIAYLLDADNLRGEFPELVDWVVSHAERLWALQTQALNFTRITIEDANIGAALMAVLKVKFAEKGIRVALGLTPKHGSKFQRAAEALPYWQQGRLLIPSERTRFMGRDGLAGVRQFETEFKTFSEADTHASDDILDGVVWEIVTRFGGAGGRQFAYGNIKRKAA